MVLPILEFFILEGSSMKSSKKVEEKGCWASMHAMDPFTVNGYAKMSSRNHCHHPRKFKALPIKSFFWSKGIYILCTRATSHYLSFLALFACFWACSSIFKMSLPPKNPQKETRNRSELKNQEIKAMWQISVIFKGRSYEECVLIKKEFLDC